MDLGNDVRRRGAPPAGRAPARRPGRPPPAGCWLTPCAALSCWGLPPAAPATPAAAPGAPRPTTTCLLTKPIEDVRVGDRVLVGDPQGDYDSSLGDEVDPEEWRRVDLVLDEGALGRLDVVLLRPDWWLERAGAAPGRVVQLEIAEVGAVG